MKVIDRVELFPAIYTINEVSLRKICMFLVLINIFVKIKTGGSTFLLNSAMESTQQQQSHA